MSFPIIDAHVHPFYHEDENFCRYPNTVNNLKEFRLDLQQAGIKKVCGSVIKCVSGKNFEEIRELNRSALILKKIYGDFYVPGIHIHPNFLKESCEELQEMHRKGVRLIGELVPYMMGYESYTSQNALEIFRFAGQLSMTVCIHPTKETDIEALLKNCPQTNFIIAHPGELAHYETQLMWLSKYENAYYDLSATGLFRYGMLRYGIDKTSKEKFLFGSDYPICNPKMQAEGVLFEKLTSGEYEAVFYKNAERLLAINVI